MDPHTHRRLRWLLFALSLLGVALVASALLIPRIQAARERARSKSFAWMFGHGSADHFTYHLSAGGRPHGEYEKQIFHLLERLVPELIKREDKERSRGLTVYTTLYVHAPSLTGDCLGPLSGCTKGLDALLIEDVQLSPGNVNAIGRTTSLRGLAMRNAGLTDESLDHLAGLRNLQYLDVRGNGITADAAHAYESATPGCTVAW